MYILYVILSLILAFIVLFVIGGWLLSAPVYRGQPTDHFNGKKFLNYGGARAKGFRDIIRWMMSGEPRPKWIYQDAQVLRETIQDFTSTEKIKVYFINHSSFLIQFSGLNFLTDPIFSEYASPFQWAGPKRMRPPGIEMQALPRVDYILLSHNHYDHLDLPALQRIRKMYDPIIICPLGVDLLLRKKGFQKIKCLDWWESVEFNQFEISVVPSQHFSARGMFDRDRTLWCGFIVSTPNLQIYYVGDTGYGNFFKQIGDKFGPMDLSIIPIGAYNPRWFMSPIHCDPDQAIRIHSDVKSRKSIPCHYGTFPLAMDGQTEPIDELVSLSAYQEIQNDFIILTEGKSLIIEPVKTKD